MQRIDSCKQLRWVGVAKSINVHFIYYGRRRRDKKKTRIPIPNQGENSIFQYPRHLQLISSRMHQNFTEFFPSHFFYLPFSLALTPSRSPFFSQAPSLLFIHHLSSFSAFLSLSPRLAPFVCTLYFGAFIFK